MEFGEHDAGAVDVIISNHRCEGFAPESVITIVPNADHRTSKTGADGLTVSSKMRDKSAEVTVTLLKTSRTHRFFLGLLALDEASEGGAGVGSFYMRDRLTGEEDLGERCWIKRRPDRTVEAEAEEIEWKFIIAPWTTKVPAGV